MPTYNIVFRGSIIQQFNDKGECLGQEFMLDGDQSDCIQYEYEDDNGAVEINKNDMPFGGNENFPIVLLQPDKVMVDSKTYFGEND